MKRKNSSEQADFQLDLTKEAPTGRRDSVELPVNDPLQYSDDESCNQMILKEIRQQEQAEEIRRIEKMKQSQSSQQSLGSQQSIQSRNSSNSEDKKRERRAIFEKYKNKEEPQPTQQNDKNLLLAFENIFKRKENVIKNHNDTGSNQQIYLQSEANQLQRLMDNVQQRFVQPGQTPVKDNADMRFGSQFDQDNNLVSSIKEGNPISTISKIMREDPAISGAVSKIYAAERNSSVISARESHDLEDLLKENIFNDVSRLQDRDMLTASLQLRDSLKMQPGQIQIENSNFPQLFQSSESPKVKQPMEMVMLESSETNSVTKQNRSTNEINISHNSDSKDQGDNDTSTSMTQIKLSQPPNLHFYKIEVPFKSVERLDEQFVTKQVQPLKPPNIPLQQDARAAKITSTTEISSPIRTPITSRDDLIGSQTPISHMRSNKLISLPVKAEPKSMELMQALPQTSICQLLREAFRLNSTSANLAYPEVSSLAVSFRRQFRLLISELTQATSTLITLNTQLLQIQSRQIDLRNNFKPQAFIQGLWVNTLSKSIHIIKPTQSLERRVCDHIQIQSKLSQTHQILKQLLVIIEEDRKLNLYSKESKEVYVAVRCSLNDILAMLFKISEDLYMKAFVAYIPDHYTIFYQYLKVTLPPSHTRNINSVIKQRQAMKVLVNYMRECNDPLCSSRIGRDLKIKLENELKTLKRDYYQQKQHITLA